MANWSTRAAVRGMDGPDGSPPGEVEPLTPVESDRVDCMMRECQLSNQGELTVTERLATLLDSGQFADVTIRVGQGPETETFKAHRLLLASASPPLYQLVSTVQMGHADLNSFRVTDVEPQAFKNVLKFIYTDKVEIDCVGDAFGLMKAGTKWGLTSLNSKSVQYVENFLENFVPDSEEKKNEIFEMLLMSEPHSSDLFDRCLNLIIKHAEDIIPCQGFLKLDDKTIRRIFAHKKFKFEDQLVLFESIKDWGMNQIIMKGLNPALLHPTIEDLLTHVDFSGIQDDDFMSSILPSECLGRAEIISFFMTRGMEIPRDMGFNNNMEESSSIKDMNKVGRFKRGFKLPHKEVHQEHEVRFRVDKHIKLLGISFGFLFSNTDMGVTVHVKGPWERVQWTDMAQTYCRVNFESMKTADVKLMLNEPVKLEANHSYKILVKISRMTSGGNDVELWGGKDGAPTVVKDNAKFYFIKAACSPNEEPSVRDLDTKQSMVTELLYLIDESPRETISRNPSRVSVERDEDSSSPITAPTTPSFMRQKPTYPTDIDSLPRSRNSTDSSSYKRWQPTTTPKSKDTMAYERQVSNETSPGNKAASPEKDIASYLRKRTSPTRERKIRETPSFLKPRTQSNTATDAPFGERLSKVGIRSALPWSSSRGTTNTTEFGSSLSTNRYGSTRSSAKYGTETPSNSNKYGTESTSSRYGTGSTSTGSKYGSSASSGKYGSESTPSSTRYGSNYGSDSTSNKYGSVNKYTTESTPSKYGSTSTTSRYGSDSSTNKYGTGRYGADSTSSKYGADSTSKYGADSTSSKYGTDSTSKYGTDSTSKYGTDSTSKYGASSTSKYGTDSTSKYGTDSTSKYGTDSTSKYGTDSTSKYGTDSTSKYGTDSTSKYGTSTPSKYDADSTSNKYGSGSNTSRYGTNSLGSSSKYGSASNAYNSGSSSSKYGTSASSTPSYLSKYSSNSSSSDTKPYSASNYRRDSTTSKRESSVASTREPSTSRFSRAPSISSTPSYKAPSISRTASSTGLARDSLVNKIGSRFERPSDSSSSRYGSYGTGSSGYRTGTYTSRFR